MFNCIEAVHYLVYEYYPQEVPLAVRANAAIGEVEDLFGEPVPSHLPPGEYPVVTEEQLVEWVSDYAFRSLGNDSWALVDLTDGNPFVVLTPAAV